MQFKSTKQQIRASKELNIGAIALHYIELKQFYFIHPLERGKNIAGTKISRRLRGDPGALCLSLVFLNVHYSHFELVLYLQ